jgi:hypothetical protein
MTGDDNDELVNELTRLRAENARLAGLLKTHGIAWREPEPTEVCAERHRAAVYSFTKWFASRTKELRLKCRGFGCTLPCFLQCASRQLSRHLVCIRKLKCSHSDLRPTALQYGRWEAHVSHQIDSRHF